MRGALRRFEGDVLHVDALQRELLLGLLGHQFILSVVL